MAFENTELFDQIATDALKNYGWEDTDESKLIVLSENATYMVKNKETGERTACSASAVRVITHWRN